MMTWRKAVRYCGSTSKMMANAEIWLDGGEHAHARGLLRCSSPWECPDCARRIGMVRREELEKLATAHRATGGELYHLTLTAKHPGGTIGLAPLRKHVPGSWSKVIAGKAWTKKKSEIGLVGQVRALDTTVGPMHGWHPHLHILLLTSGALSEEQLLDLTEWIYARWVKRITRPIKGTDGAQLKAPSRERGILLKRAHVAGYLAEASICWPDELASHTMKEARGMNRTPWQVLHDLTFRAYDSTAEAKRDLNLWTEWGLAMKGAKQLTWSNGLKKRYGIDEKSDEAAAQEELQLDDVKPPRRVATVPAWEWNNLVLPDPELYLAILEAAEVPGRTDDEIQAAIDALVESARRRMRPRRAS
jgi:hypothetical protein